MANNYRHLYSEYEDIHVYMRHASRQSLCMAIAMITDFRVNDFRVLPRKYRVFDFTFMDNFFIIHPWFHTYVLAKLIFSCLKFKLANNT